MNPNSLRIGRRTLEEFLAKGRFKLVMDDDYRYFVGTCHALDFVAADSRAHRAIIHLPYDCREFFRDTPGLGLDVLVLQEDDPHVRAQPHLRRSTPQPSDPP